MKKTKKKTTRTSSPAKGNKKAPKKALKKTTAKTAAKKPAVQTKKTTAKRSANTAITRTKTNARSSARRAPAKKKDIFEGATEIAITDNKIVVTRQQSKNVQGKFEKREVREYHDKSPANLNALNRKLSSDPMKKVSVKFK